MTRDPRDKMIEIIIKANERKIKEFDKIRKEQGFSVLVSNLFSDLKLALDLNYLKKLKEIDPYMAEFNIPASVLAYCCYLDEFLIEAPDKVLFFYVFKYCEFYRLIKTKATTKSINIFYVLRNVQRELEPYYRKR